MVYLYMVFIQLKLYFLFGQFKFSFLKINKKINKELPDCLSLFLRRITITTTTATNIIKAITPPTAPPIAPDGEASSEPSVPVINTFITFYHDIPLFLSINTRGYLCQFAQTTSFLDLFIPSNIR